MKQKIIKSLLAIACLLSSTSVSAYDFEVDGIYYDMVSMTEFTCAVTQGDKAYEGDFVIPATVNFANKTLTIVKINCRFGPSLTSITIPNTISELDGKTFENCSNLTHVTIEDGETVLKMGCILEYGDPYGDGKNKFGEGLFYRSPLTSLYLGRDILYTNIQQSGLSPFARIGTLKNVIIGNSVTEMKDYLFYSCGLTDVIIGNSVTTIGNSCFWFCSNLTSVTIGNAVTTIGKEAFCYCRALTSVELPNSVTEIGQSAFKNCYALKSINIPNSVVQISRDAFFNCTDLTSVTIDPESLKVVSSDVFYGCRNLKYVYTSDIDAWCKINFITEPSNPLYYARHLYLNGVEVKHLVISDSVNYIGRYAFFYCENITGVTLGSSCTSIGENAFAGNNLTALYSLNLTPPNISSGNFTNKDYMGLKVYVPYEALETYQNASGWENFWNIQGFDPAGIEHIKPIVEATYEDAMDIYQNYMSYYEDDGMEFYQQVKNGQENNHNEAVQIVSDIEVLDKKIVESTMESESKESYLATLNEIRDSVSLLVNENDSIVKPNLFYNEVHEHYREISEYHDRLVAYQARIEAATTSEELNTLIMEIEQDMVKVNSSCLNPVVSKYQDMEQVEPRITQIGEELSVLKTQFQSCSDEVDAIITGIANIFNTDNKDIVVYNINGLKQDKKKKDLKSLPNGVYIINSKKVIVK